MSDTETPSEVEAEGIPVVGAPDDGIDITEYDRGRIHAISDYHQELFDALKIATTAEQFARGRVQKELGALAQRLGVDPEKYVWLPQTMRFVRKQDGAA